MGSLRVDDARRVLVACVAGVVLLGAEGGPAYAQPPPPPPASVLIVPPACASGTALAIDAFVGILTAELRADGVERVVVGSSTAPGQALAAITLRAEPCEASAREIVVTIEDYATTKRVERHVALGDTAETARPRALALAVAELLRATWLELTLPEAPPPTAVHVPDEVRTAVMRRSAPTPSPPPPTGGAPERETSRRWPDVSVAVAGRAFASTQTLMYGGNAALAVPVLTPSFSLRVDAAGLSGTAHDPLGDVTLGLASAGASLLFTSPREAAVAAAVGPRLELGVAWASGSPVQQGTTSHTGAGFVSTASLLGAFYFRLTERWKLAVELEGGATLASFEARADSRRVTSVDGAMFGVAIGLARR